ncbi:RTA1 like protein-domain-containing protein [Gloeopeniophorella convolvens]|nr:RTA1 like protein-domain-containing protein [Gloeopeniophorella convolvens]
MSNSPFDAEGFERLSLSNYKRTEWVCITFVVLFGLTTLLHLSQAVYSRRWFLLISAVLCGVLEIVGWSGRLWTSVSHNPSLLAPFIMQNTTTLVAPTRLLAGCFDIFAIIINQLGPQYARLSGNRYKTVSLLFSFSAAALQIVGSILSFTNNQSPLSSHLALGGIIVQLVGIVLFVALILESNTRFAANWPIYPVSIQEETHKVADAPIKLLLVGISVSTFFIFVRCIFRTVELAEGWRGKLATTEWYFAVFDAAMIVIAMFAINVFHPGFLLRRQRNYGARDLEVDEVEGKDKQEHSITRHMVVLPFVLGGITRMKARWSSPQHAPTI